MSLVGILPEAAYTKFGGMKNVDNMLSERTLKEAWVVPLGGDKEVRMIYEPRMDLVLDVGFKQKGEFNKTKDTTEAM